MNEFEQAFLEVQESIEPYLEKHPELVKEKLMDRIRIPDRVIMFKVTWMDDNNQLQVNTGYRVQFNNALGTYKGGFRFHPNVNLDVMKFLAFEQIFKNALTGLDIGGAKGGSDFDPKGKSEGEIQRFCQAFMSQVYTYIGPDMDVPAGDMGVGAREIGYMIGEYKRLTHRSNGFITGKPQNLMGSLLRPEATGYGLCYITERAMKGQGHVMKGKRVLVSGAGNVGLHAAEKAAAMGAIVVGMSSSAGAIYDPNGLDIEEVKRQRIETNDHICAYAEHHPGAQCLLESKALFTKPCDVMLFCATQNEADIDDVKVLYENGCRVFGEGANMPLTLEATNFMLEHQDQLIYLPGKAANAGGVAVSALEMSQNAGRVKWTSEEVDALLQNIMNNIYEEISFTAKQYNQPNNFVLGANITAFDKVVQAMKQQGY